MSVFSDWHFLCRFKNKNKKYVKKISVNFGFRQKMCKTMWKVWINMWITCGFLSKNAQKRKKYKVKLLEKDINKI